MFLFHWLRRRPHPRLRFRPTVLQLEDRTVPSLLPALAPATHLKVIIPETSPTGHQIGKTFDVWVQALDAHNRLATGYTGAIKLRSSDLTARGSASSRPALRALTLTYTFTTRDFGFHIFHVNLKKAGSQSISATDTRKPSIRGRASTQMTSPAMATTLVVSAPAQAATGVATHVQVEMQDQSRRRLVNFTSTVTVVSHVTSATGATEASPPITYTVNLTGSGLLTVYPPDVVTQLGLSTEDILEEIDRYLKELDDYLNSIYADQKEFDDYLKSLNVAATQQDDYMKQLNDYYESITQSLNYLNQIYENQKRLDAYLNSDYIYEAYSY